MNTAVRNGLVLALALTACGREDPKQAATPDAEPRRADPDKPSAPGTRPDVAALRVDELPDCDTAGRIVYLATTEKFNYCDADGTWHELAVKGGKGDQGDAGAAGPKGDTGDTGADGARGDQGVAGAQGPQGPAGAAGAAGQTVAANMWYDPVAAKWWLMGWTVTRGAATDACTAGYRLPTDAELLTARSRGLCKVDTRCAGAPSYAWTSSGAYSVVTMSTGGTTTLTSIDSAITYCVQQ